jgi:hypothetical protein
MSTDSEALRLCWRAADRLAPPTPAAVVEACGRCGEPVLVDRVATPDPPGAPLPLLCVPCAYADPELRENVIRTWKAARRLASALPPASRPSGRRGA